VDYNKQNRINGVIGRENHMDIRKAMTKDVLFFDGGMGTMIQNAGLKAGEQPEIYNIKHPEIIKSIHRAYLDVGVDIITTNTFGANEYKLKGTGEKGAFIVDVREEGEYKAGHLINAVNIPLSQLRERLDEIPKDQPVYLACRSSQRSYNAVMALQNLGYTNIYNISGSFLGICYYEYFTDMVTGRKKIVTDYNFN
jgi:rhodanese-related sulfurtransferase